MPSCARMRLATASSSRIAARLSAMKSSSAFDETNGGGRVALSYTNALDLSVENRAGDDMGGTGTKRFFAARALGLLSATGPAAQAALPAGAMWMLVRV